ncbi:MAG TPA: endonuclease III [Euryarchaeota archaeon]|nr:endonuclease III [Euryarchaeota archaeon]
MELNRVIEIMEREGEKRKAPVLTLKQRLTTPFRTLVSVLISSRTKDETTSEAADRLFRVADSPSQLMNLSKDEIEKLIYPVGFYRVKAGKLRELGEVLAENYNSDVPETFEELIKLPGIGRKSANVVLAHAFNKPAIGVDTHVHRISNRLGLVKTSKPRDTERKLNSIVADKLKARLNRAFVAFGQSVCKPVKPLCSQCPLAWECPKIHVKK